MIHFFDPSNAKMAAKVPDIAKQVDEAWRKANQSVVTSLGDQRQALLDLVKDYDGSATATHNLALATSQYRAAAAALLIQIRQVTQAVKDMFADTRQSLRTFGLSGRDLYNFYKSDADEAMRLLATETDPTRIQQLSQRVNNDINAAFNALPDEDKQGAVNPLLQYLNGVDAYVTQRLATIGQGVTNDANSAFAIVQQALNDAADKMNTAADKNVDTASSMSSSVAQFGGYVQSLKGTTFTVNITGLAPEVNGG